MAFNELTDKFLFLLNEVQPQQKKNIHWYLRVSSSKVIEKNKENHSHSLLKGEVQLKTGIETISKNGLHHFNSKHGHHPF